MKNKIVNYVLFIVGAALIIYYIKLTSVMGHIAFSKYLCLGGIALCIVSLVNTIFENNKTYCKIRKILNIILCVFLIIFLVTEAFIGYCGLQENYEKSDYTIVLGAGLRGENMTLTLKQRVDTALKYLKSSRNTGYVVVSGGQGQYEVIAEAEAMKRYLAKNHINEKIILMEGLSTNTYENLEFSKNIIELHSGKSIDSLNIKIVTSGFHLLRAKIICNELEFDKVTLLASPINKIFIPTYYTREFFGFYKMLLFDVLLD
ncbi:YdcF family protein [Sedimentibacter sp. zth1]|uniref:YdcF family protein n=1 Tax=Sedimentibacter sp. zth1 TaxID=2816908 RepID=UPI001A9175CE|nr:YdcF family protein [Sedimentibacter sp. zth1]QSX05484.1 YdcF family protein [Sedimentibacter sp. zth1]